MATILQWKSQRRLSFTDIAKLVGFTRTKVYRHATGNTPVDALEAAQYIEKSGNSITLDDLCKPRRRRKGKNGRV